MRNTSLKKMLVMLGVTSLLAATIQPALTVCAADVTGQETAIETTINGEVGDAAQNSAEGTDGTDPAAQEITTEPGGDETQNNAAGTVDPAAAEDPSGGEAVGEGATVGVTADTEYAAVNEPMAATPVEEVTQMLEAIDTLQQMQDNRKNYTNAEAYSTYLTGMREQRALAKAAYENLTDEEKRQISEDLSNKLNDTLDTVWHLNGVYPLEPRDDEYNYQAITSSPILWVAYELSNHMNKKRDIPVICPVVDVSGSAQSWTPSGPYAYGESNYEVCYCIDLRTPVKHMEHYKRVNLESSEYYTEEEASHIRAIVESAYPYVTLDEMKDQMKTAGFSWADDLTRSDVIAAVQFAIWRYANQWTDRQEIMEHTTYGATFNASPERIRYFDQLHVYLNELWNWWPEKDPYEDPELRERVDELTNYLVNLPGKEPADDQIIISDVKIARTDLIPGEDDTYTVGLDIFLNHGSGEGDNVTITVITTDSGGNITDTKTIPMGSATEYAMDIKAKDGDTVTVTAEGTQYLAKGVYFYDPEDGIDESQALVGVAQGETRVKAEKSFTFEREIDAGIRIFKTAADTDEPMEDIEFSIYKVPAPKTAQDVPTQEEIDEYAVPENLAGSVTTDATGYAHIELDKGVYLLIEEPNDKIKAPIWPMYVELPAPVETVNDQGEVIVTYDDVATLKLKNIPYVPGRVLVMLEATKDFNDWGKAGSFRFVLDPVTEGAPMPSQNLAEATLENKTAQFDLIEFRQPGTYEYTITEIDDGEKYVTYDTEPHKVVVTITQDEEGDLHDEVTYDGADRLTITNTYKEDKPVPTSVILEGHKTIKGTDKTDQVFHFVLKETSGGSDYRDEASVTGSGNFSFKKITYEEEGVYKYTITETKGDAKNWKYDSRTYEVTVTVVNGPDNKLTATISGLEEGKANFTNKYEPPTSPKVGDDANYALWGALAAAAAAGIGAVVYFRRKKDDDE